MEAGMFAGLAITVLGMAIVFCFIALLALAIHLLSRFKGKEVVAVSESPGQLVAVISGALHAHRAFSRGAERRH